MEKNPHSNTKKVYKNVHKIFNYRKWWILSVFLWAAVKLDSQGIIWISICVNRKVAKFTYPLKLFTLTCKVWLVNLPFSFSTFSCSLILFQNNAFTCMGDIAFILQGEDKHQHWWELKGQKLCNIALPRF